LCALSGITGPQDVEPYIKTGVGAVLVGEALMRAKDTTKFIGELLGGDVKQVEKKAAPPLLVKICGTRSADAAKTAIEAGADLIGIILVEGRKRCVSTDTALAISRIVHDTAKPGPTSKQTVQTPADAATSHFTHTSAHHIRHPKRALLVGVFQNQPLPYILAQQKLLNLDIIQLHGSEPLEWASLIPVPVLRAFKPGQSGLSSIGLHSLPLLDSGTGGTGENLDTSAVQEVLRKDEGLRVLFAGGLNHGNVQEMVKSLGELGERVVGVDVSSGVEDESGAQDLGKIREFVRAAKAVR
jgi:anthranilate synthase/indole-3-glycerol phosphate synthase/phosphoribosylanthranilate isomerase